MVQRWWIKSRQEDPSDASTALFVLLNASKKEEGKECIKHIRREIKIVHMIYKGIYLEPVGGCPIQPRGRGRGDYPFLVFRSKSTPPEPFNGHFKGIEKEAIAFLGWFK